MPRIAAITVVVVAAVVVAVVLSRGDGGGTGSTAGNGEVFLQAAGKTGPDPFTESTATDSSAPPITPSPTTESAPTNTVRGVNGGAPGLYGGTRNVAACDVEKQIEYLQDAPDKNRAFASVVRVDASDVPAYLRSLTPVQLRMDTRVTNHGYRDGAATEYQAVLQAGTAVMVDSRGVPRVRCACGNPLTPPVAQQGTLRLTGDSWPSYSSSNVVVVSPSKTVVEVFVIYDPERKEWIARERGDEGRKDKKTDRPAKPSPSVSTSTPKHPDSPSTCATPPPGSTCPPTSTAPTSPPTDEHTTDEPTTDEPTTQPETPETSESEPADGDTTTTSQSESTVSEPGSPSL